MSNKASYTKDANDNVFVTFNGRKTAPWEERFVPSNETIVGPSDSNENPVKVPTNKTVIMINSVAKAPDVVEQGALISAEDVLLNVTFDDESTGTVQPTLVICDTSVQGGTSGTAYYGAVDKIEFKVYVTVPSK